MADISSCKWVTMARGEKDSAAYTTDRLISATDRISDYATAARSLPALKSALLDCHSPQGPHPLLKLCDPSFNALNYAKLVAYEDEDGKS